MRTNKISVSFVQLIPKEIEDGVLYVSMEYKTAIHKCPCGCGKEVVTPFSPVGWKIIYDGVGVTLNPSIGNFSYPCESHYFINNNTVVWAQRYSKSKIEKVKANETKQIRGFFNKSFDSKG